MIQIPIEGDRLKKLFKVEKILQDIGISFDTGYDLINKIRDWEFDWSLKGAKVYLRKIKEE